MREKEREWAAVPTPDAMTSFDNIFKGPGFSRGGLAQQCPAGTGRSAFARICPDMPAYPCGGDMLKHGHHTLRGSGPVRLCSASLVFSVGRADASSPRMRELRRVLSHIITSAAKKAGCGVSARRKACDRRRYAGGKADWSALVAISRHKSAFRMEGRGEDRGKRTKSARLCKHNMKLFLRYRIARGCRKAAVVIIGPEDQGVAAATPYRTGERQESTAHLVGNPRKTA